MSANVDPVPVELVPQPDNRLQFVVAVFLGVALILCVASAAFLAWYDKTMPTELTLTMGTVSGGLVTLLVPGMRSSSR